VGWRWASRLHPLPVMLLCAVGMSQIVILIFSLTLRGTNADFETLGIAELLIGLAVTWYAVNLRANALGGALVLGWSTVTALWHLVDMRQWTAIGILGCVLQAAGCPATLPHGAVSTDQPAPRMCPKVPWPFDGTVSLQVSTMMGVSRPVGRVLCTRSRGPAVIHLGLSLPTASCGLPASIGRATLDRSRRELRSPLDLAPGGVYRAAAVTCGAGGLLHHRFTLTPALARGRSVFCGTVPRVAPGRRYRPPCPVEPGPSSPGLRPARPPGRLTHS
jgi:hypothetical protein